MKIKIMVQKNISRRLTFETSSAGEDDLEEQDLCYDSDCDAFDIFSKDVEIWHKCNVVPVHFLW